MHYTILIFTKLTAGVGAIAFGWFKNVVLIMFLFMTGFAQSQTIDDYASFMNGIGCGTTFLKVIKLPVPLIGYSPEAERRIGPTSEMRTTAYGVVSINTLSSEKVRQRLLLNPINLIDKMDVKSATTEFAYYLSERALIGNTDAVIFERATAETLLCLLEKRKGLKPEVYSNKGVPSNVGEKGCSAPLESLLEMLLPPPSVYRDLMIKQIRNGLDKSSQNKRYWEYSDSNFSISSFNITDVPAPKTFSDSVKMWTAALEGMGQLSSQKLQNLPLVPSKKDLEMYESWGERGMAAIKLAGYWVCQRAHESAMDKWFSDNQDKSIYWSSMGPTLSGPTLGKNDWQLHNGRLEKSNVWGKPTLLLTSTIVHTCFNVPENSSNSELYYSKTEKYPLCNTLNHTTLSRELFVIRNHIEELNSSKNTSYIGTGNVVNGRVNLFIGGGRISSPDD
jgi:hypothetical protein